MPATRRQLDRALPVVGVLDAIIGAPLSVIRSVEKRRRARKWDAEGSKKTFNNRKELGWRELDVATTIDKVRLWLHDFDADVYEVRADRVLRRDAVGFFAFALVPMDARSCGPPSSLASWHHSFQLQKVSGHLGAMR